MFNGAQYPNYNKTTDTKYILFPYKRFLRVFFWWVGWGRGRKRKERKVNALDVEYKYMRSSSTCTLFDVYQTRFYLVYVNFLYKKAIPMCDITFDETACLLFMSILIVLSHFEIMLPRTVPIPARHLLIPVHESETQRPVRHVYHHVSASDVGIVVLDREIPYQLQGEMLFRSALYFASVVIVVYACC